jgi:hypothetical protein
MFFLHTKFLSPVLGIASFAFNGFRIIFADKMTNNYCQAGFGKAFAVTDKI